MNTKIDSNENKMFIQMTSNSDESTCKISNSNTLNSNTLNSNTLNSNTSNSNTPDCNIFNQGKF